MAKGEGKGRKVELPDNIVRWLTQCSSYRLRKVMHNPETPKAYRRAIYAILLKRRERA